MPSNVLSLIDYEKAIYRPKHQDKVPVRRKPETNTWFVRLLVLALLAINVMSAGHTIPIIQEFYAAPEFVKNVMGLAGFIGIEGLIVLLMSQEERGFVEWLAITLAFLASLVANVYSSTTVYPDASAATLFVAILLGVFAPAANLSVGQVFHKSAVSLKREEREIEQEYKVQLGEYQTLVQSAYTRYLSSVGVKSAEERAIYLSGEQPERANTLPESGTLSEERVEHSQESVPSLLENEKLSPHSLARILRERGESDLTYNEIAERHGVSNNLISKAKKILRES